MEFDDEEWSDDFMSEDDSDEEEQQQQQHIPARPSPRAPNAVRVGMQRMRTLIERVYPRARQAAPEDVAAMLRSASAFARAKVDTLTRAGSFGDTFNGAAHGAWSQIDLFSVMSSDKEGIPARELSVAFVGVILALVSGAHDVALALCDDATYWTPEYPYRSGRIATTRPVVDVRQFGCVTVAWMYVLHAWIVAGNSRALMHVISEGLLPEVMPSAAAWYRLCTLQPRAYVRAPALLMRVLDGAGLDANARDAWIAANFWSYELRTWFCLDMHFFQFLRRDLGCALPHDAHAGTSARLSVIATFMHRAVWHICAESETRRPEPIDVLLAAPNGAMWKFVRDTDLVASCLWFHVYQDVPVGLFLPNLRRMLTGHEILQFTLQHQLNGYKLLLWRWPWFLAALVAVDQLLDYLAVAKTEHLAGRPVSAFAGFHTHWNRTHIAALATLPCTPNDLKAIEKKTRDAKIHTHANCPAKCARAVFSSQDYRSDRFNMLGVALFNMNILGKKDGYACYA